MSAAKSKRHLRKRIAELESEVVNCLAVIADKNVRIAQREAELAEQVARAQRLRAWLRYVAARVTAVADETERDVTP